MFACQMETWIFFKFHFLFFLLKLQFFVTFHIDIKSMIMMMNFLFSYSRSTKKEKDFLMNIMIIILLHCNTCDETISCINGRNKERSSKVKEFFNLFIFFSLFFYLLGFTFFPTFHSFHFFRLLWASLLDIITILYSISITILLFFFILCHSLIEDIIVG